MMQFFQGTQPRMVWDPKRARVVVTFEDGIFLTEDPGLIKLLTKAGYRGDDITPKAPKPKADPKPEPAKPKPKRLVRKKKP